MLIQLITALIGCDLSYLIRGTAVLTVAALYADFIEQVGQSNTNLKNYRLRSKLFLEMFGGLCVEDVGRSHVNQWYATINERDIEDSTKSGFRQAIIALFNYARREGFVNRSPADHLPAPRFITTKTKAPSEIDVDRVAAVAFDWMHSKKPRDRRAAAFFVWSLITASRLDGLRYLRLDEFERGLRRGKVGEGVYRFRTKSKGVWVTLEATDLVIDATLRYLEVRPKTSTPNLFVGLKRSVAGADISAVGMSSACKDYRLISAAAGLDPELGMNIRSHDLRHRIGMIMTEEFNPKIAAMKLNHADAESTAATAIAFYYRPKRDRVEAATVAIAAKFEAAERGKQIAMSFD